MAETSPTADRSWMAIVSLVLGIISLCAWLLPVCGLPVSAAAMVLGFLGRETSRRGLAIAGIVLGGLTLLAAIVNAAVGAYLGLTGQLEFFR